MRLEWCFGVLLRTHVFAEENHTRVLSDAAGGDSRYNFRLFVFATLRPEAGWVRVYGMDSLYRRVT